MVTKTAPVIKTQGGARTAFTDEQVAHIKSKILELIPQGWTIRQLLAEPGTCSMTYLYRDSLPVDEKSVSNSPSLGRDFRESAVGLVLYPRARGLAQAGGQRLLR